MTIIIIIIIIIQASLNSSKIAHMHISFSQETFNCEICYPSSLSFLNQHPLFTNSNHWRNASPNTMGIVSNFLTNT